ncbi:MAG: nucleotide exchange factor GrpE [Calditrichaeota bacterium]|nr:MAG: nucleotide exchange factor GrpE [Calditrichota bacterium]
MSRDKGAKKADETVKQVKVEYQEEQMQTSGQETSQVASGEEKVQKLEKELQTAKKKIQELEEQSLRIRAEFSNFKRRVEKERLELADYIKGEFIKKLLPVLDDFKMMLEKAQAGQNEQSVLEGARMIFEKLQQILQREGLEKIESLGEPFDPNLHEALMTQPTEDEAMHERVVQVFQEGYKIKDRLLRPSRVVVGKLSKQETEAEKN